MAKWANMSHNEQKEALALKAGIPSYRIVDIWDDYFVYYEYPKSSTGDTVSKYYRREFSYSDETGLKLGIPSQVTETKRYDPVIMSAEFSVDDNDGEITGDEVIREGLVFKAGEYPDVGFNISESEMEEAARDFSPVKNDLEHRETILSGKLGQLKEVRAKGQDLIGKVAIPKWLNSLVGKDPIKVSLAWDRATKKIVGNALVLNPRVAEAQLTAAFNAANNPEGGPKVPDTQEKNEKQPGWYIKLKALFTEKKLPEELNDFDPETVTFKGDEEPVKPPENKEPVKESDSKDSAEFSQLKAENEGLKVAQLKSQADIFFNNLLQTKKVFPGEKDSVVALFMQAVKDDNLGKAYFSRSGEIIEGERVKMLRAQFEARPSITTVLTEETISSLDPKTVVLLSADNDNSSKGMTPERRQQLLKAGEIRVLDKENK